MNTIRALTRHLSKTQLFGMSMLTQSPSSCKSASLLQRYRNYATTTQKQVELDEMDEDKDDCMGKHVNQDILKDFYTNIFFMPDQVGLAYQCPRTTFEQFTSLDKYLNSSRLGKDRIMVEALGCPKLMEPCIEQLFPDADIDFDVDDITILNLNFYCEEHEAQKNFVLTAREMCLKFHENYWADFINPFSGRPFFMPISGQQLYDVDERFRGLNMTFDDLNGCVSMRENFDTSFAGAIFTTAPLSLFKNLSKNQ